MPVPEALLRRGAPRNYLSPPLVEILRRPDPNHPKIDSWYSQHLVISKDLLCSASSVLGHLISAKVLDNLSYHNLIQLPTALKGPDDRDATWPVFVLFYKWLTEGKVETVYGKKGDEVEEYGHHILWEFGRVYGCPVYQNTVLRDLARVATLSTEENPLPKITPKDLEWLWTRNSSASSEFESRAPKARPLNPAASLNLFEFYLCLIVGDPKRRALWEEIIFHGGKVAVEFASQTIGYELWKCTGKGKINDPLTSKELEDFQVDEGPMTSTLSEVTYAMAARKASEPKPNSAAKSMSASSSNCQLTPQEAPSIFTAAEMNLSSDRITALQENEVGENRNTNNTDTDELSSAFGAISLDNSLEGEGYVLVHILDSESDSEWSRKL